MSRLVSRPDLLLGGGVVSSECYKERRERGYCDACRRMYVEGWDR